MLWAPADKRQRQGHQKYHPIRFYVMNTDVPRILISHAASYWLGLVRVLCDNKAPRIKRQVASIDKNLISKRKAVISGPVHQIWRAALRRNRWHRKRSLQERATFQVQGCTVSRTPNYKQGRRPLEWDLAEIWTSVTGSSTAKMNHLRQLERNRRHQNRVTRSHSGPNKKITDSVKDGPFSNQQVTILMQKTVLKWKIPVKRHHVGSYYRPSHDTKTFQINNKGHLQCLQDPKLIHKPNDKGKLPGSREAPIYHEPGTVSCKTVEDLKKLYPNSFDRLGSLKGAYNIRIDPSVKPSNACQEEGANRVQRSNRQGTGLSW